VALAAACNSGSDTLFDEAAGAGGASTAAGTSSAGSDAKAGSAAAGSSNPSGGMLNNSAGSNTVGGVSASGASSGGAATSEGGSSASGGNAVNEAGEAGTPHTGGAGASSGGADGAGEAGVGGDTTQAGAPGAAGNTGEGGSGDGGCSDNALAWSQRASNVMLLVDRSGTMFDVDSKPWTSVRDAVLPVLDAVDATQSIGFMAVSGEFSSCPLLDEVAPALSNYTPIATQYNALGSPPKGESPFMLALSRAKELLAAAPAGDAFVIMVIDGQPDYCNDGDDLCPIDSVVSRIQLLRAAGITTFVAGLPIYEGADTAVYAAALQSYANAGAGLPAASVGDTPANIYFRCQGGSSTPPSWKADFNASGKPAQQALGAYSASPGSAQVTSLDPTDAASLTTAFSRLFARTQSCSFETTNGKVVLASAESGLVKLGAQKVDYDATNGWHMKSDTVLELVGSACDTLRATPAAQLTIDFPCEAVSH
jgi:hypothetical protein